MQRLSTFHGRCTIQLKDGSFCDTDSVPGAPYPICLRHGSRLFAWFREAIDNSGWESGFLLITELATKEPNTRREHAKQHVVYYCSQQNLVADNWNSSACITSVPASRTAMNGSPQLQRSLRTSTLCATHHSPPRISQRKDAPMLATKSTDCDVTITDPDKDGNLTCIACAMNAPENAEARRNPDSVNDNLDPNVVEVAANMISHMRSHTQAGDQVPASVVSALEVLALT